MIVLLFIANSFLCAALLFWVQPMFARMALPLLGGSPAVWNTAMVFYQAVLLAGYAYAHSTLGRLGVRRQAWLHLIVLLLPLLFLPVAVPAGWLPPTEANPIPWLLMLLLFGVGVPFFVVSASSPILQRWFSALPHPNARDPYFLYAAGNLGSVLGLLSYPLLIEPNFTLEQQASYWSLGYAGAIALTACCGIRVIARGRDDRNDPPPEAPPLVPTQSGEPAAWNSGVSRFRQRAGWLILSFIPCSLMLGVTSFITTDLAAVPLLWVIPLALYLSSFILVFSRRRWLPHRLMTRLLPIAACAMLLVLTTGATEPLAAIVPINLAAFFIVAMACHGTLADSRPPARRLTEFYLCLSIGGVLGGAFNALLAPFLFTQVLEYPITFALACTFGLLGVHLGVKHRFGAVDLAFPAGIGLLAAALLFAGRNWIDLPEAETAVRVLTVAPPVLLCFLCSRRPLRFGLAVGAVLLAGYWMGAGEGRVLHAERSFFGVHRVTIDREERFHRLIHGNTFHGKQSLDPELRRTPLAYYHPTGPMGQVFAKTERFPNDRIAMVGLGTGALAAYGKEREEWRFYEIDPVVKRIARDTRYFTYLHDSPAGIEVVLGDARLSLERAPDAHYGLIVLDAYSSDAIPVHLLTREALQLYRDKLAPGGLLAFHISNVHLDLRPVTANLAHDAGLHALFQADTDLDPDDAKEGKLASEWILMAERRETLAPFVEDPRWEEPGSFPRVRVWTDNYSSLFEIFRRR